MFSHYLVAAFRNFKRFKVVTCINVLGLALGLASFIAAYAVVAYLRNGETQFGNADRIYVIAERTSVNNSSYSFDTGFQPASSMPVARHLRSDFPELEVVGRLTKVKNTAVSANDALLSMKTALADGGFLAIFDLPYLQSVARNALLDGRRIVVSADAAVRLFGTTQAVGKTVRLRNSLDVAVSAVVGTIQSPSHIGSAADSLFHFDILLSPETFRELERSTSESSLPATRDTEDWFAPNGITYALLPSSGSFTASQLNERLARFAERHIPAASLAKNTYRAMPVSDIALAVLDTHFFHQSGWSIVGILFGIAATVLIIACINYGNLNAAQLIVRSKDIGLRQVLGATSRQTAMQYLLEAACQTVAASVLAIGLLLLFSGAVTDYMIGVPIELTLGNWYVCIAIAVTAVITAILASIYPLFSLFRSRPIGSLRGSSANFGAGSIAKTLVGVQFATASFLLIVLGVVQLQNTRLQTDGLNATADPVVLLGGAWQEKNSSLDTWRNELLTHGEIKAVSGINVPPWTSGGAITTLKRAHSAEAVRPISTTVDYDFETVLDLSLLAGRSFDRSRDSWSDGIASPERRNTIVIDRALAQSLGWKNPKEAIGQTIVQPFQTGAGFSEIEIIGVVENKPLRVETLNEVRQTEYHLHPPGASNIVIRISKNRIPGALAAIDSVWRKLAPDIPVRRKFMDEFFEEAYKTYRRVNSILTLMTSVSILISMMGLFGMTLMIANRRTHEIGVRKTLGASVAKIISMLVKDFSKPVLLANLLIWPLAYLAAQKYLNIFVLRIDLTLSPFLGSLAFTLFIASIAVGAHAWRAARVNPAEVLRHE